MSFKEKRTNLRPSPFLKSVMAICIIILTVSALYPGRYVPLPFAILTYIATAIAIVLFFSYRIMKKKIQLKRNSEAESITASDDFILYLRPFVTSGNLKVRNMLESKVDTWIIGNKWDIELALTLATENYSNIIAVGHDSRSVGAFKISSDDNTWKENVLNFAQTAKNIIIVPLDRPSTLWEAEQILSNPKLLSKTIIVMPSERFISSIYNAFIPWKTSIKKSWRKSATWLLEKKIALPEYKSEGCFIIHENGKFQSYPLLDCDKHVVKTLLEKDAKRLAKLKNYTSKSWTFFGDGIGSVILPLLIAIVLRTFLFQPFSIPSGSMKSTLLVGDYLFVSKFSYGYSKYSLPFSPDLFEGRIWASEPERGDIAVFKFPPNPSIDYIKRVIGLPGDKVQMINGILHINGEAVKRVPAESFLDEDANNLLVPSFTEILPNGVLYNVLDLNPESMGDNTKVFEVPEGYYFMMGDNRDNSADSRFEVGFVPFENFVGKAQVIFFSIRNGTSPLVFWKWPSDVRFDRISDGL